MIWAKEPPYPNWLDYAIQLESYAADRMADPAHSLPAGLTFASWMAQHVPLLESDPVRRADNTIIAKKLLPIFETDPNRLASYTAPAHLEHALYRNTC